MRPARHPLDTGDTWWHSRVTLSVAPTRPRSPFGDRLRAQLDQRNVSIRALSRRMNPGNPEVAKRSLLRWISGRVVPSPVSVATIADALGCEMADLSDDDEEADQEMRILGEMFLELLARVEAMRKRNEARS